MTHGLSLSRVKFRNILPTHHQHLENSKRKKKRNESSTTRTGRRSKKSMGTQYTDDDDGDDDMKISTMSLEDFFAQYQEHQLSDAEKDRNRDNTNDSQTITPTRFGRLLLKNVTEHNVEVCFREALKCIFSPIRSQLSANRVELDETYENLCLRLVEVMRVAFPDWADKFEKIWEDLYMDSFPPLINRFTKEPLQIDTIDFGLQNLYLRKDLIERAQSQDYSRQNFSTNRLYNTWKDYELLAVDTLVKEAMNTRSKPYLLRLALTISRATIGCSGKKLTNDFLCKVRLSSSDKEMAQIKTTSVTLGRDGQSYIISFASHVVSLDLKSREHDLILHLYKKGVMKMRRYGELRISQSYLLQLFHPAHCSWGACQYESTFDIMDYSQTAEASTQTKIGSLDIKIVMQMEMHPKLKHGHVPVRGDKAPDFYKLFDILVEKLIESNRQHYNSKEQFKLLTFYQEWVVDEFGKQHGISEIYKRLAMMRHMVNNTNLLLCGIDDFKQYLDYVISTTSTKSVVITVRELELLHNIKEELTKKIEYIVSQFLTLLQGGRRVLKILIELLEYMHTRDNVEKEPMSHEDFSNYLTSLLKRAIESDYDTIKQDQIEECGEKSDDMSGLVLIKLVQFLTLRVDDILYYSWAVPDYINFDIMAIDIYYDKFDTDYERVVKKKGLTGYQMLFLCHKLEFYHNEILDAFQDDELEKKIRLMNLESLMRGYDEKFILELKDKLTTHIQRSVKMDPWSRYGGDCLYSQSLIDIFTSANQFLSSIAGLDFINESMLDMYATAVGDCIVEYARTMQQLCINEIIEKEEAYAKEKASQNKHGSIIDLKSLFFSSVNDSSGASLTITPEFIIKLNNIEASREQYKCFIDYVKDKRANIENQKDNEDEENYKAKSDNEETSNSDSLLSEEEESEGTEVLDVSTVYLKTTLEKLDVISDDLIAFLVSQFDGVTKISLTRTMQHVRTIVKKSDLQLSDEELAESYGKSVIKSFREVFVTPVLTPNLTTLSSNIYEGAFSKILLRVYGLILRHCTNLMMPDSTFGAELSEVLNRSQIGLLKHLVNFVVDYFYGGGDGIPREILDKEKRFINSIFKMVDMPTSKLISMYDKLSDPSKTTSVIKSYHVVSILSTRRKGDKSAKQFLKANKNSNEKLFILQNFGLHEDENYDSDRAVVNLCHSCVNDKLKQGTYFLLPEYLLWMPTFIFNKRVDPDFIKSRTSVDSFNSKCKIYLRDIKKMRNLDPFIGKGVKLYFDKLRKPIKLHFETKKARDVLVTALLCEANKKGYSIQVLDSSSKKAKDRKTMEWRSSTVILDTSVINPAMIAPKDIGKTIETRFGISATLKDHYTCQCAVNEETDHSGTLYLFDNCFFFDAYGNLSIDSTDLIASWFRVEKVQYDHKKLQVQMTLDDSRRVVLHDFLSDFPEVSECIEGLVQAFRNDEKRMLNMKRSDPNTYFQARFGIKGDELLRTITCSIPGKTLFASYGVLYIGKKHLGFEKDSSPDVIVIKISSITSLTVQKSWQPHRRSRLEIIYNTQNQQQLVQKFIKPKIEEICDLIKQQMK